MPANNGARTQEFDVHLQSPLQYNEGINGPQAKALSAADKRELQILKRIAAPASTSSPPAAMTGAHRTNGLLGSNTGDSGTLVSALDAFLFGPFRLIPGQRQLLHGGVNTKLGGRAFDLLVLLVSRANEIIGHRELLATVWSGVIVEEGSLRVQVAALRKVLGDGQPDVRYVLNIARRGYCFVAPVTRLSAADRGPPSTSELAASAQGS